MAGTHTDARPLALGDEIADYLGVSKDTVYAWLRAKRLPGHKIRRFWKFKKEEVDEWVRAGAAGEGESS